MSFKGLLYSILIAFSVTAANSFATDLANQYPQLPYYGPNCWNFTLMHKKAIPFYRTVSMHEFWYYLNSPYCRQLNPNQKPSAGDIGSVMSVEYGIVHSFALVSENMILSKGSPYPESQIEEQLLSAQTFDKNFPAVYHRCDFSKLKIPKDELYDFEVRMDQYLTKKLALDKNDLLKMLTILLDKRDALFKSASAKSKNEQFYKMITLFKIESLTVQTFMLIHENENNFPIETIFRIQKLIAEIEAQTNETKNQIQKYFK